MTSNQTISDYQSLIDEFVKGQVTADEFERQYLTLFKQHTGDLSDSDFEVLNNLFTDVDAYCPDPDLRDEDDISEEQLLSSAKSALLELGAKAGDQ